MQWVSCYDEVTERISSWIHDMAQFPTRRVVREGIQVDGYKACPYCNSIDIDYPSSKIHDTSGAPITLDTFPSYSSYWCYTCNVSFETWAFKPADSSLTSIDDGTLNAGF